GVGGGRASGRREHRGNGEAGGEGAGGGSEGPGRSGWEGLIAKRADAPYARGRSKDWLKLKCVLGQELVTGGYTAPAGSRTDFGALLVGYYEGDRLRYAGKVGTGFSAERLRGVRGRWARPGE